MNPFLITENKDKFDNKKEDNLNNEDSSLICLKYSISDIQKITNNFESSIYIDEIYSIYRGTSHIDGNRLSVLKITTLSQKEAMKFLSLHCRLRHPNLLILLGYCEYESIFYFVFEDFGSSKISPILPMDILWSNVHNFLFILSEICKCFSLFEVDLSQGFIFGKNVFVSLRTNTFGECPVSVKILILPQKSTNRSLVSFVNHYIRDNLLFSEDLKLYGEKQIKYNANLSKVKFSTIKNFENFLLKLSILQFSRVCVNFYEIDEQIANVLPSFGDDVLLLSALFNLLGPLFLQINIEDNNINHHQIKVENGLVLSTWSHYSEVLNFLVNHFNPLVLSSLVNIVTETSTRNLTLPFTLDEVVRDSLVMSGCVYDDTGEKMTEYEDVNLTMVGDDDQVRSNGHRCCVII